MSREQLVAEALLLDKKDRELLAEELLLSVDLVPASTIEELWKKEAQRRLDSIVDGSSTPIDGPVFMEKLRSSRL